VPLLGDDESGVDGVCPFSDVLSGCVFEAGLRPVEPEVLFACPKLTNAEHMRSIESPIVINGFLFTIVSTTLYFSILLYINISRLIDKMVLKPILQCFL
jgi:hypothetical protein